MSYFISVASSGVTIHVLEVATTKIVPVPIAAAYSPFAAERLYFFSNSRRRSCGNALTT